MFHLFRGHLECIDNAYFLVNDSFGIQVTYKGTKKEGMYFIYPYLDDTTKTIQYFAFDTSQQKSLFEKMLKITGIGPKTAFNLATFPLDQLKKAVDAFDLKIIQSVPGIGPKTAKRLLLELKTTLTRQDIAKINLNDTIVKTICKTLTNMGYDKEMVIETLEAYPDSITKKNMNEIIVWVVQKIALKTKITKES